MYINVPILWIENLILGCSNPWIWNLQPNVVNEEPTNQHNTSAWMYHDVTSDLSEISPPKKKTKTKHQTFSLTLKFWSLEFDYKKPRWFVESGQESPVMTWNIVNLSKLVIWHSLREMMGNMVWRKVCVCVGAFMENHLNTYCRLYIKHIYLKGEHMLLNAWYTLVAAPFFWATNWTLKGCWICWSTLPKEG